MILNNLSIISAKSKNNVIGDNNTLIWHLPSDLKYFKEKTQNKTIVMGRNTYESLIPFTKGKPLPNRTNIVLTKQNIQHEGFTFYSQIEDILAIAKECSNEEVFIIGGAQLYKEFLPYTKTLYLTEIKQEFSGDTYFPELNDKEWDEVSREFHDENSISFDFVVYKRN